jgi:DNA-binding response OmpR family regulator
MSTVLVVDDEERITTFLSRSLSAQGHTVLTAAHGTGALAALAARSVDLVLLDLMMPGMNGLQCLSAMRKQGPLPSVIVLSGVTDVAARVQALDGGAVDFVAKPFHLSELIARTRRHLAASPAAPSRPARDDRYLEAGSLRLDLDRRRVRAGSSDVVLAEREFALLAHLVRRRGDVCRRDELLHDVWQLEFDPGSNVIEACLRRLRAKLPGLPIEAVRGIGYCFDEEEV